MTVFYKVTQNSDLMEGKGAQLTKGYFDGEYVALEFIQTRLHTDMGGGYSARIVRCETMPTADSDRPKEVEVWGYRKGWDNKWGRVGKIIETPQRTTPNILNTSD